MARILIIEDDLVLANLYKKELTSDGFEVDITPGGKEGIVEAMKMRPDFILLDLIMSQGMGGITALNHLKSMPETQNIPVAIITVVPEGVPQRLTDPKLSEKVVGYWAKDKYQPSDISKMVKDYLSKNKKI